MRISEINKKKLGMREAFRKFRGDMETLIRKWKRTSTYLDGLKRLNCEAIVYRDEGAREMAESQDYAVEYAGSDSETKLKLKLKLTHGL